MQPACQVAVRSHPDTGCKAGQCIQCSRVGSKGVPAQMLLSMHGIMINIVTKLGEHLH